MSELLDKLDAELYRQIDIARHAEIAATGQAPFQDKGRAGDIDEQIGEHLTMANISVYTGAKGRHRAIGANVVIAASFGTVFFHSDIGGHQDRREDIGDTTVIEWFNEYGQQLDYSVSADQLLAREVAIIAANSVISAFNNPEAERIRLADLTLPAPHYDPTYEDKIRSLKYPNLK